MQSHAVTIKSIAFHVPATGFAVLDCQRIGTPVRVVGDIFDPKAGEDIIVHGDFTDNESLGYVFAATAIVRSEAENALAELDFNSSQRTAILRHGDPFNIDSLTLERANAAADAVGMSITERVSSCINAILWRQPIDVGVKQTALETIVSKITGATPLDVNQIILALSRKKVVEVTKNGTVVGSAAIGGAERLLKDFPKNDSVAHLDRLAFDRLYSLPECSPNQLLQGEKDAVFHALTNSFSIINIARQDRANMIEESIRACALRLSIPNPTFQYGWFVEGGPHVVVFMDLNENTEQASIGRAFAESRYASVFHAPPYAESPIDRTLDELGNRGRGLSFTALVSQTGTIFTADEGDFSVTHAFANTQSNVVDVLAQHASGDSIFLSPVRSGDFGTMELSREMHARQEGIPTVGPYFIGERVIRDGLLTEVSAGDDADCSLAWVTTIDEAQRQEKRWETVVAVVPTNAVPWYWAYGVMKLATKRVIFVGPDQAVKAIGRTRAALPVNQAVYDRAVDSIEKEVAV